MATKSSITAGNAFIKLEAVDKTGHVLRKVGNKLSAWAGRMDQIGRNLIKTGVTGMAPFALSLKVFANFDDALKKVEARSKGTAKEMAELRGQAKDLGRTTSFTASAVGELQAKVAQKGFDRRQIKAMTKDILNLARAAGEGDPLGDSTIAADLVTGTLRAFKLEATDAGRVSDIFASAVNNSNFTMQSLMDSMKFAGPVARQYGLGLEETVATLGQMTNLNIDASTAGTSMRNMLLRLSNAAGRDSFNTALQRMTGNTVDFVDEAGNLRVLPDILFDIGRAMDGLGTAQQGQLMNDLLGMRAITGGMAISGNEQGFKDLFETLKQSQGAAERTAKTMDSGIGGVFRKFISAAEGVGIAVAESITKPVEFMGGVVTHWLGIATHWISNNQGIVATIGGLFLGLTILGGGILALALVVKVAAIAIGLLGGMLTFIASTVAIITSPWVLLAAAIVAVIAVLYKVSSGFRNFLGGIKSAFVETFGGLLTTVGKTMKGIITAVTNGNFNDAWDVMVKGAETAWLQFVDIIMDAWSSTQKWLLDNFEDWFIAIRKGWIKTQQTIANGMLDLAKQGGILGDLMDLLVGMDVSGINERGKALEEERIRGLIKLGINPETGFAFKEGESRDPNKFLDPNFDPFADAQKAMNDHFDHEANKSKEDILATLEKEDQERQRAIEQRKEALNAILQKIDTEAKLQEEAANAEDQRNKEMEDALAALAGGLGPNSGMGPQAIESLEKGTVEAARQAFKNQQKNKQTDLLGKINANIEEQNELLREGVGLEGV